MRRRHRHTRTDDRPQLEMTPMIDVVFQLLIFFIVTLKQEDILSQLDVTRPMAETKQVVEIELLEVIVYNQTKLGGEGYSMQGKQVRLADIERHFRRIASFSTTRSVIIKCTNDSPHSNLVRLLDVCAEVKLRNISVFSM